MKKLLLITYYWPPMGGGGVQRWLKFVKYLREYGWDPVVFTPEGANISIRDESLFKDVPEGVEVIRHPIREPYSIYNRLLGKKKDEGFHAGFVEKEGDKGKGWMKRFTMWIRGALFIPDAKMLWIGPASRRIKRILKERSFDAMVSTGPPHTTHLIAEKVKRKHPIPWLADFRDPWTEIDFFHHLPMPKWAEKRHQKLEKRVLQRADRVVTVSWSWAKDLERIGCRKVDVVTNGFDHADFPDPGRIPLTDHFSITHAGAFNKDRNPEALWEAMGELAKEEEGFEKALKLRLIGPTDHLVLESIQKARLENSLEVIDQLPHKEVIPYLCASWVLLLPVNNTPNIDGVIPGKLYEYIGAARPILCTGKANGDAAWILQDTGVGDAFNIDDKEGLKTALKDLFMAYRKGDLQVQKASIDKYERKTLAGRIAGILNELSGP